MLTIRCWKLPWQTSWQQLKDHVRTVATAERVEVFNESTSGWVLVRGRENFDAALRKIDSELHLDKKARLNVNYRSS